MSEGKTRYSIERVSLGDRFVELDFYDYGVIEVKLNEELIVATDSIVEALEHVEDYINTLREARDLLTQRIVVEPKKPAPSAPTKETDALSNSPTKKG
jgi:hypothetical protein